MLYIFTYRDIKPENFLVGKGQDTISKSDQTPPKVLVHIVDFGLAKQFIEADGRHIPYEEKKGIMGTARFMSINAHKVNRCTTNSTFLGNIT